MDSVFNLIFYIFQNCINWLKSVELAAGVSLFHFSVALLIMSVVISAFVPTIKSSSGNMATRKNKGD